MLPRKLWNMTKALCAYVVVGVVAHFMLYGVPDVHSASPFVFLALWPLIIIGRIIFEVLLLCALLAALLYLWD